MEQIINIIGAGAFTMIVGLIGVLAFVVLNALALTWVERKVAGHMQRRIGPKEVGPYGLIQPIADALKLLGRRSSPPARWTNPCTSSPRSSSSSRSWFPSSSSPSMPASW